MMSRVFQVKKAAKLAMHGGVGDRWREERRARGSLRVRLGRKGGGGFVKRKLCAIDWKQREACSCVRSVLLRCSCVLW